MKKLTAWLLLVFLIASALPLNAMAKVKKDPHLDAAFTMLEKDNIFLRRYNELTGSNIQNLFELGVPYYFGGQFKINIDKMINTAPDYWCKKRNKENEGVTGNLNYTSRYFFGFDCHGFVSWVYKQVGRKKPPNLKKALLDPGYRVYHVFGGGTKAVKLAQKKAPPFDQLKKSLKVGDCLIAKHGPFHIMMYIGTLRDYGFTKKEVPELADYLDYPLVIHSGGSPFYKTRFKKLIESDPDKYQNCEPPTGGVQVSIIGVPKSAATHTWKKGGSQYYYFKIDGGKQEFLIWDISVCTSYCWFRYKR